MEKEQVRVTLMGTTIEKLDKLCDEKGVLRSSIISMAIDLMYKDEEARFK